MTTTIDDIIDAKIAGEVATSVAAAVASVASGPPGPSPYDLAVQEGFVGTKAEWLASLKGADGIGGVPQVPSWTDNSQVGGNWPAMQAALLSDEARFAKLPKSTGGKTNLSSSFPSQVNQFSSALSLPENRHYLGPHTSSDGGYTYIADIQTLQNAAQAPGVGAGVARTGGMVLFPDGEILLVPYCSTSYYVMQPSTETSYTLPTAAPGNYAYLGGALWIDGVSAVLAPHNQNYAVLVNKSTGIVTQLTGYNFGGNYACAGVRRCSTGEYYFVPHNHNKHVFLNPETMVFRTLTFNAPGAESYVGCTHLSSGEIYVATHKAACSVVIDPVAGTKVDTLPPSGPGYVAPTSGISNFRTCVRVPDGRVVLVPFSHTKAWIYDRATNKHTQMPGTYSSGAVASATLTAWGDVMLWPWNGNAGYRLSTGYGAMVDPQIVTSPLFNGL